MMCQCNGVVILGSHGRQKVACGDRLFRLSVSVWCSKVMCGIAAPNIGCVFSDCVFARCFSIERWFLLRSGVFVGDVLVG